MQSNHKACISRGKTSCSTAEHHLTSISLVLYSPTVQEVHGPLQRSNNSAEQCTGPNLNSPPQQMRAKKCGFDTWGNNNIKTNSTDRQVCVPVNKLKGISTLLTLLWHLHKKQARNCLSEKALGDKGRSLTDQLKEQGQSLVSPWVKHSYIRR